MTTNGRDGPGKLVQVDPLSIRDMVEPKTGCNKKRIRRIADPHIEPYRVHGEIYYRYRRGTDRPIYLGTADSILRAVREKKNGKH